MISDRSKEVTQSRKNRLAASVRSLRHRNFQLFFAGQLISLIGTWMQTVAQAWLVFQLVKRSSWRWWASRT
jgi:hypothetical protein